MHSVIHTDKALAALQSVQDGDIDAFTALVLTEGQTNHMQNKKDHRTQHKHDNWGRKNKERPDMDTDIDTE